MRDPCRKTVVSFFFSFGLFLSTSTVSRKTGGGKEFSKKAPLQAVFSSFGGRNAATKKGRGSRPIFMFSGRNREGGVERIFCQPHGRPGFGFPWG